MRTSLPRLPALPRALLPVMCAVASAVAPCRGQGAPPPDIDDLRRDAFASIEQQRAELCRISDAVWRFAETSLGEERSSAELADYLQAHGFAVERGIAGMPTAFVATAGSGSPVIGILAEFDALPGISNQVKPERVPVEDGAPGHGCGHNLFGAASAGAAVAANEVRERHALPGTIKLFGCPAEETVIGKVYMAKAGVFDGLDACLDWHPGQWTGVDLSSTLAMNNFRVEFRGRSAHGAADPWNGRSALDAVELMNHAVNMLREHVRPTTRIHYVIADGGGAPNVVPDHAVVWYYVRDVDRAGVEATYARVLRCAEGAAIATDTEHRVELTTAVHDYLLNRTLSELLERNLQAAGAPAWSEADHAFAKAIQRAEGVAETGMFTGIKAFPGRELPATGGSTDVAEVSRITPTAKLRVASSPEETAWHAWPVVACGGGPIGHEALRVAARALGAAAAELLVSPDVLRSARDEFAGKTAGARYVSPIPEGQAVPKR